MKQIPGTMRNWIIRATAFAWLAAIMSVGTAQTNTVSYTLDNIFLNSTQQMTGTFEWNYDEGNFENGSGLFRACSKSITG